MRVLFVISGLAFGGAERQVILLARELARRGHAACIYTLTREAGRLHELSESDVELVMDQKRRKLDPAVIRRLRRHIRAWRPDIVHGFLFDGNLYSRLAAWGSGIPVLNSERNDNYDRDIKRLHRAGYRLTSMLCDGVVANSHAGAQFARRLHRLREAAHVVWNGIELSEVDARLARGATPAREIFPGADLKRLCMVAALRPQKDHGLALRVLKRLIERDPAWRLICVGDEQGSLFPGYKARIMAERDRLQLEPFVKFVGNRRDVLEIVASSDLSLLTSLYEGFPNAVLEAMACGTAVVSTDYSDVRRILPVPESIVGSRSEDDIAAAVLECHGRRAEIVRAQRRWVESHATMPAVASELLRVYARYLAGAAVPLAGERGAG
jgi:glycosyltransferase involved in cell wall biosynthesis